MEIRQLRYFLEIAQRGHLTEAAKQLFVTQSTLSHGLRQLEQELGVELFERVGRGLKLSEAGTTFRVYAARALQELEVGRMALASLSNLEAGTLTVGIIPTFLHSLVPAVAAAFNQRYPNIQLNFREMLAPEIEALLASGDLHVGLAFDRSGVEGIISEPIFEEQMLFVAHRDHPMAKSRALALQDLQDVPLVLLSQRFATRRMLEEHFKRQGVQPLVRVEMESVYSLIEACRSGPQLACLVPDRVAMQHATGMCQIRLEPMIVRMASLLWNAKVSRSPAAQAFAQLLRRYV